MLNPRYLKMLRDISADRPKNLMLVLAIAIGVFGVGTMLGSYAVLTREMAGNYLGTVPASATVMVESADIDEALVRDVRAMRGIALAERRSTITARMQAGGQWYRLLLFVVDDFADLKTNKFTRVSGAWPPPQGTMLVERTALELMQSEAGGKAVIRTPHGTSRSVPISGVVLDPTLAPARQERTGYGYVTQATAREWGETQGFNELRILLADPTLSIGEIEIQANAVARFVAGRGHDVHEVQVPPPRRHPHQGQMVAVLLLFIVFSFLTLILGAILVATSISVLMARQVREIGVMKAIGAKPMQISVLYFMMILTLAAVAVAAAIPLSRLASGQFITAIARLLNLDIRDSAIPAWVPLVQAVAGIAIPMAVAALPVLRGGRITVREALDSHGVPQGGFGQGRLEALLARLRSSSDLFTLSLRNVFRRRGRLIMTLGLLATGGAVFMAALNLSRAWEQKLQNVYKYRHYDLEMQFVASVPEPGPLLDAIRRVPGVKAAEAWQYAPTAFTRAGQFDTVRTYPDKGHGSFALVALPESSPLIGFPVMAGRWLGADGGNETVLNHMAHLQRPELKVGDAVTLSLEGRATAWRIVGFVEDIGSPAVAYVTTRAYARAAGSGAASNMFRVALVGREPAFIEAAANAIETVIEGGNTRISTAMPIHQLRNAVAEHMGVLVNSLLALAVLMAAVGALGLTSTMSMSILERTRELGVMRAIGATPRFIARLVVAEGLIIGALSLVFAFVLSLILAYWIGVLIGEMAFRTPLDLAIAPLAALGWVGLVIAGSVVATLYPAFRASRLTTREALAYE